MDRDYREKSEFNDAIGHLRRMDALFYTANHAAMRLDSYTWFHSLTTLSRELTNDMKPKEEEEIENLRNEIAKIINKPNPKQTNRISADLYEKLHLFEKKIRKLYEAGGYQGKRVDEARFEL